MLLTNSVHQTLLLQEEECALDPTDRFSCMDLSMSSNVEANFHRRKGEKLRSLEQAASIVFGEKSFGAASASDSSRENCVFPLSGPLCKQEENLNPLCFVHKMGYFGRRGNF